MGLSKEPLQWRLGRNIYITNDAEIKEGDYFYQDFDSIIHKCYKLTDNYVIADKPSDYPKKICKKIILTTDQDLIKDGVQPIDDEFLEWFVKNPNCEEVKIEDYGTLYNFRYLILIPQEEPKQERERGITITNVGKQETLEEASKRLCLNTKERVGFYKCYSWQQERMYSEEDVISLLDFVNDRLPDLYSRFNPEEELEEWFEQFKKK
jgi:hypothetical protein